MTRPVPVLHLITELAIGGAQRSLHSLLAGLDRARFEPGVACLYNGQGEIGRQIRALGIPVTDLRMQAKWRVDAVWRLWRLLRRERPVILHAWMIHANILGRLAGRLSRTPIVVVSRRTVNLGGSGRELVNRLLRPLADRTIAVSEPVRRLEIERARADPERVVTIPNGVDLEAFGDPSGEARRKVRGELSIPLQATVIGVVAQMLPHKGHSELLQAVSAVCAARDEVVLLAVGDGPLRRRLETQAAALGLRRKMFFAGIRTDIPEVLAAFDLFVLASYWEGLPVAVLEAMASGLPVVATDVGGTSAVVVDGETGMLVPPRDVAALARALTTLIDAPDRRRSMGRAGRRRVAEHFDIRRTVARTRRLYEDLLERQGARGPR